MVAGFGQVCARKCAQLATKKYSPACSTRSAALMATDSEIVSRSARLLYECAVGTDLSWVEDLIVFSDMKDRDRNEEVALAYACVLWRVKSGAGGVPDTAFLETVCDSRLTPEQLVDVAGVMVHLPSHRPRLSRVLMHGVCVQAATSKLKWRDMGYTVDAGRRARLIRLLSKYGSRCNFTSYGDGYVERRLKLLLPTWSTVSTPYGRAPHHVSPEVLKEGSNDIVRPILDINIATYLKSWEERSEASFCAAVACMQEITGGYPVCYLNQEILRKGVDDEPAVVYVKPSFARESRLGVWTGDCTVEYATKWSYGIIDCLLEWMSAARDMGLESARDVCDAVLDNNSNSPVHAYIAHVE